MTEGTGVMQRYESYKPSGVKWLGDIPSHWDVRPGFTCFKENKDRNKGLVESTVLSLSYGRIVIKPEEKLTGLVPESFESYQLIKPGDIVIRTTDLQNDQTSLRVGYAKDKGIITSAYLGLRCHPEINPEYVFRLLESYDALKIFYGMGSGLRQNINFWDFKRLPVPLPPRDEQDRIVAFLDQKTAEIDAAIAKKRRLIDLQQTKKLSLIYDYVTKGIDSTNSLRPSSIKWLKEIPSHWKVLPGFTCYSEIKQKNKKLQEKTVLSLSYGKIIIKPPEKMTGLVPESFDTYQILKPGDIVVRTTDLQNDQISLRVGLSKNNGIITSAYLGLRCNDKNNPEYLSRVLEVYDFLKVFYSMGSGMRQNISFSDFKRLPIILPPITEQIEIIHKINTNLTEFDKILKLLHLQIEKLFEFKRVLIATMALGKIKV
jgi:type I restriction enzyme S subunit